MRRIIYKGLVGLPAKLTSAAVTAFGAIAAAYPKRVEAAFGEAVTSESIQFWGFVALGCAVVYFMALWLLKPGETPAESKTAPVLTATGDKINQHVGDMDFTNSRGLIIANSNVDYVYIGQPASEMNGATMQDVLSHVDKKQPVGIMHAPTEKSKVASETLVNFLRQNGVDAAIVGYWQSQPPIYMAKAVVMQVNNQVRIGGAAQQVFVDMDK